MWVFISGAVVGAVVGVRVGRRNPSKAALLSYGINVAAVEAKGWFMRLIGKLWG